MGAEAGRIGWSWTLRKETWQLCAEWLRGYCNSLGKRGGDRKEQCLRELAQAKPKGGEKKALTKSKGKLFPDFLGGEHQMGLRFLWTCPQAGTPGQRAGGTAAFGSCRRTAPSMPFRSWQPCRRLMWSQVRSRLRGWAGWLPRMPPPHPHQRGLLQEEWGSGMEKVKAVLLAGPGQRVDHLCVSQMFFLSMHLLPGPLGVFSIPYSPAALGRAEESGGPAACRAEDPGGSVPRLGGGFSLEPGTGGGGAEQPPLPEAGAEIREVQVPGILGGGGWDGQLSFSATQFLALITLLVLSPCFHLSQDPDSLDLGVPTWAVCPEDLSLGTQ